MCLQNFSQQKPWQKSVQQIVQQLGKRLKSPPPLEDVRFLNQKVGHLTLDSRLLTADSILIALPGSQAHGLDFVQEDMPCVAILTPATDSATEQVKIRQLRQQGQVVLEVEDLVAYLADLADWFYQSPSQKVAVVGITGTNGKTSTAFYTAQLLASQGQKVALIGTLGYGFLEDLEAGANTTPDVVRLQRLLAQFALEGADFVVMEVSSHAIALGRIARVQFQVLALTQVTRDHLDFHGSEQAYRAVKKQLFLHYGLTAKFWVLNQADVVGQALIEALAKDWPEPTPKPQCLCYAADHFSAMPAVDLWCTDLVFLPQGLAAKLHFRDQSVSCQLPLLGAFNVENLLCALGCALGGILSEPSNAQANKVQLADWEQAFLDLRPVTGRMQSVVLKAAVPLPVVVIDYAHTPDALAQALQAFRQHLPQVRLSCVFGCGGERDQGKRALMGQVAVQYADQVVITTDNPRCESPQQIIEQILAGIANMNREHSASVQVIEDRAEAIQWAIQHAEPNEGVLIAGKGHEQYQQFCQHRVYFSDEAVARLAMQKRASIHLSSLGD